MCICTCTLCIYKCLHKRELSTDLCRLCPKDFANIVILQKHFVVIDCTVYRLLQYGAKNGVLSSTKNNKYKQRRLCA